MSRSWPTPRSGSLTGCALSTFMETWQVEEWIPKSRLLVPWSEADAFFRDELCMLKAVGEQQDDLSSTTTYRAAETVFAAMSRSDSPCFGWRASDRNLLRITEFEATVNAMELPRTDLLGEPSSFIDRHGTYWAPFSAAERLAKWFCAHSPRLVLQEVRNEELRLHKRAVQGLNDIERRSASDVAAEGKSAFEMVREWCGGGTATEFDEIRSLQEEISRLRALVESAVSLLNDSGHKVQASRLLKALVAEERVDASNIEKYLLRHGESAYRRW